MTKEEIEQYIDLDNKIKNRIVQISHALKGISGIVIKEFVPDFRYWNLYNYDKVDFIENTNQDKELHLGLDCYDGSADTWICNFNKSLLTMTDAQVNEIVEYDRKEQEEKQIRQNEAEEARQKQVEKDEYEQYLRLKKKFEPETVK